MNRGTGLQGIETRRYVLYIEQVQRPYREGAGCTNLAAGNERGSRPREDVPRKQTVNEWRVSRF
jgi:hypothetical protein